jgi:hypothetical protein
MKNIYYSLFSQFFTSLKLSIPAKTISKEKLTLLIDSIKPRESGREMIRLGGKNDGGYLVPNDLSDIAACFSPGIDTTIEFEKDCANLGMELFLIDGSIEKPKIPGVKFHFLKKFIGSVNNKEFTTLESWVKSSKAYDDKSDYILQADIEGHEYEMILSTPNELLSRFRIMVFEFHWVEMWINKDFFKIVESVMSKILKNHVCVHIHPNNQGGHINYQGVVLPRLLEFTFYRKDRLNSKELIKSIKAFPNPLDEPNVAGKKDIRLSSQWFSN